MKKCSFALVVLFLLQGIAVAQEDEGFKNLQVLDPDIAKDELKAIMNGFTEQLDVKCTYCHVLEEYHKDDKEHKRHARGMIRLVRYLKENAGSYFPEETSESKLGCWTCHRAAGSAEIEEFDPAAGDDEW